MNDHMKVITNLVMDDEFRDGMAKDVDSALTKYGFNVAPEFISKLKEYGLSNGFDNMRGERFNDVNDLFETQLGLDPKW